MKVLICHIRRHNWTYPVFSTYYYSVVFCPLLYQYFVQIFIFVLSHYFVPSPCPYFVLLYPSFTSLCPSFPSAIACQSDNPTWNSDVRWPSKLFNNGFSGFTIKTMSSREAITWPSRIIFISKKKILHNIL